MPRFQGAARKISRSKIDLFIECPRCLYLVERLGVKRPSIPAFTLNSATDHLLKKEFDVHRKAKEAHPLMSAYGLSAIPYAHPDLEKWRHNFTGVQHLHEASGLLVFGAVDDVWQNNDTNELMVVDYKSTSTDGKVTLEGKWKEGYKRQMEVYQWLLRQNGFPVSNRGYFVYVNAQKDRAAFDARLEFDVDLLPYDGNDNWVVPTLVKIKATLDSEEIPTAGRECEYCAYRDQAGNAFKNHIQGTHPEAAQKPTRKIAKKK